MPISEERLRQIGLPTKIYDLALAIRTRTGRVATKDDRTTTYPADGKTGAVQTRIDVCRDLLCCIRFLPAEIMVVIFQYDLELDRCTPFEWPHRHCRAQVTVSHKTKRLALVCKTWKGIVANHTSLSSKPRLEIRLRSTGHPGSAYKIPAGDLSGIKTWLKRVGSAGPWSLKLRQEQTPSTYQWGSGWVLVQPTDPSSWSPAAKMRKDKYEEFIASEEKGVPLGEVLTSKATRHLRSFLATFRGDRDDLCLADDLVFPELEVLLLRLGGQKRPRIPLSPNLKQAVLIAENDSNMDMFPNYLPWNQLTHLHIGGQSLSSDVILAALKQCVRLQRASFNQGMGSGRGTGLPTYFNNPSINNRQVVLKHMKHLSLGGRHFNRPFPGVLWPNLTHLRFTSLWRQWDPFNYGLFSSLTHLYYLEPNGGRPGFAGRLNTIFTLIDSCPLLVVLYLGGDVGWCALFQHLTLTEASQRVPFLENLRVHCEIQEESDWNRSDFKPEGRHWHCDPESPEDRLVQMVSSRIGRPATTHSSPLKSLIVRVTPPLTVMEDIRIMQYPVPKETGDAVTRKILDALEPFRGVLEFGVVRDYGPPDVEDYDYGDFDGWDTDVQDTLGRRCEIRDW